MKNRKSGGADGLLAEHLKNGGPTLIVWLKQIFSTIIRLEQIPQSFKLGVIVPLYRRKGHDPHICNNYRGITLTSVLSKCLEVIILRRLESLFTERGFPHPSQSVYQKGLSCIDRPVRRVLKREVRHRSVGARGYEIVPRACCLATGSIPSYRLRCTTSVLNSLASLASETIF